MQRTTDELDSYLRVKYGYPLTKESYDLMSDELRTRIFRRLHNIQENNNNSVSYMLSENTEYVKHGIAISFRLLTDRRNSNIYASKKAWEIVKEYHNERN